MWRWRYLKYRFLLSSHRHRFLVVLVVATFLVALSRIGVDETEMPKCEGSSLPIRNFQEVTLTSPPDVSVVTAYFDIGSFPKGNSGLYFQPSLYRRWSRVFRFLQNPLVVFTDSPSTRRRFLRMRRPHLRHLTQVIRVNRSSVWAFDYLDQIRGILNTRGYPRYFPNTVSAEYACVQHAKFYCLERTVAWNPFNTSYVTWLDIGYFRDIVGRKRKWMLTLPADYDESRIAANLAPDYKDVNESVEAIFKGNSVWIGGGMFFGNVRLFPPFIRDYRRALERYLDMGLSNTDQQVLLAMYSNAERGIFNASVRVQVYHWDVDGNCWFYLGYSCYREVT